MTASSDDGSKLIKHRTTKQQRQKLSDRMKDPKDELSLVIVCDMWLTGFDVPCLHTMYLDKPMQGHTLMQAIARVNRVYGDKPGGLVVDYLGIAADLKKALSFYSDAGGKGDPTQTQEQAVQKMHEKLEIIAAMYHGFPYENYFNADVSQKLSIILAAEEHILGLDDGKKRYLDVVTALSATFALAIPHKDAIDAKEKVAFFQAVKARLAKFNVTDNNDKSRRSNEELETTIRQVIDKALVTGKVIDIFDAAGIKNPNISILSEEFLLEMKGMEHKNIAVEVLKKLLTEELRLRSRINLVQSQNLLEMLENVIRRYHNKIITAVEFIEEMIRLSQEVISSDKEADELGLTTYEYAFYTAVANNKSARELMQKKQLRELAVELLKNVRQNATIDWTIRENVRSKLRVQIKRLLNYYGYPPDMQKLATDTVMKQAELLANELLNQNDNN
jgi:type I restriction enzyme R subunit